MGCRKWSIAPETNFSNLCCITPALSFLNIRSQQLTCILEPVHHSLESAMPVHKAPEVVVTNAIRTRLKQCAYAFVKRW